MFYANALVSFVHGSVIQKYSSVVQMPVDITLVAHQIDRMDGNMSQDNAIQIMATPNISEMLSIITQFKDVMIATD